MQLKIEYDKTSDRYTLKSDYNFEKQFLETVKDWSQIVMNTRDYKKLTQMLERGEIDRGTFVSDFCGMLSISMRDDENIGMGMWFSFSASDLVDGYLRITPPFPCSDITEFIQFCIRIQNEVSFSTLINQYCAKDGRRKITNKVYGLIFKIPNFHDLEITVRPYSTAKSISKEFKKKGYPIEIIF